MKCEFIKCDGNQCEANAMADSQYCYLHNPDIPESEKKEAMSKGGKAGKSIVKAPLEDIKIASPEDLLCLVGATINELRAGVIDTKIAKALIYGATAYNKIYDRVNDKFDTEYLPNNFDTSLREFCSQSSKLRYEINSLVYIFEVFGLKTIVTDRKSSDGNRDLIYLDSLEALDTQDSMNYYQHEDELVIKLKNFILKHNPDIKIDEEEVKRLIVENGVDKFQNIRAVYYLLMEYFQAKIMFKDITPEQYLVDEDNFFRWLVNEKFEYSSELYYEKFYKKYTVFNNID